MALTTLATTHFTELTVTAISCHLSGRETEKKLQWFVWRMFLSKLIQCINSEREFTLITRRIKKTFHEIQNSVVITLPNSTRSTEVRWINNNNNREGEPTYRRCSSGQIWSRQHLDRVTWSKLRSGRGPDGSSRSLGSLVVVAGRSRPGVLRSWIVAGSGFGGSWLSVWRSLGSCAITWSLRSGWRTVTWFGTFSASENSANAAENTLY